MLQEDTKKPWKPVRGYEGFYEVSLDGRVRGLDRVLASGARFKGRLLSPGVAKGYQYVNLQKNGEKRNHYVHRLVLEAFVGECPDGMEACHNNGIPTDNRIENLRWDTRSGNFSDKKKHGTGYGDRYARRGEQSGCATITEKQALKAIQLRKRGLTNKQICQELGANKMAIEHLLSGFSWKHLTGGKRVEKPPCGVCGRQRCRKGRRCA